MSTEKDMRRPKASIAAAASSLCIGLTAAQPPAAPEAPAAAESPDSPIDVQRPDSQDGVETYWTRDRMRAAKPMPKKILPGNRTTTPVTPPPDGTESE